VSKTLEELKAIRREAAEKQAIDRKHAAKLEIDKVYQTLEKWPLLPINTTLYEVAKHFDDLGFDINEIANTYTFTPDEWIISIPED
jgi:hypothetical protein